MQVVRTLAVIAVSHVSCSIIRAECHQGVWSRWTGGNGLLLLLMFTPDHNYLSNPSVRMYYGYYDG